MYEEVLERLIELKIKEHFKENKKFYKITKEELIDFCIKLLKSIESYN